MSRDFLAQFGRIAICYKQRKQINIAEKDDIIASGFSPITTNQYLNSVSLGLHGYFCIIIVKCLL